MEGILQGGNVLVLNRFWQAVSICSWRRAFCLLYAGRAKAIVVEDGVYNTYAFEDWRDLPPSAADEAEYVQTVSLSLRVPRIILLLFYDYRPVQQVRFTRRNIFERDRNTCQYCRKRFDRRDLNIDHVVPLSHGGGTCGKTLSAAASRATSGKGIAFRKRRG